MWRIAKRSGGGGAGFERAVRFWPERRNVSTMSPSVGVHPIGRRGGRAQPDDAALLFQIAALPPRRGGPDVAANSLQQPAWRKSTASTQGDCVEVALVGGQILVRDSKDPDGPRLCFAATEWAAFISGAKAGEFDLTGRPDAQR